ncbi:MAG: hypothetical protein PHQ43_05995 [Dehalococcoidales bacterium]|nr:hypothetical protein [Dehalococcoidales bacterium]
MANVLYNSFKSGLMEGTFDLDTGGNTLKVVLVTSTYSPDIDTHTQYSHITNQVTGDGYTAGGATLGSQAVTTDTVNDRGKFDAADVTWSNSTLTARGAVIYKYIDDGGSPDATSPLIGYWDFTEDKVSSNGDFTIQWNADGIILLGSS